MLDVHTEEHGMTEVWPPALVNAASARGTGQIPDKEDLMYIATRDELYLVPTAEVPVTNLHRDEIFEADQLPIRYAAYSPCFRREAGAAGKDTRGILRVHQFDKVEMVFFEKPENSTEALEWLTGRAEVILQRLGLAYRVLLMATKDMGFVQAKKYDLEVWAPGVERWLEVSSCSNFRDYQARRMAIRYRPEPGAKPELVHTLNGSGLALARTVAAIIETYQQDRRQHGRARSAAAREGPYMRSAWTPTAVTNVATITTKVVTGSGTSAQCGAWKFSFKEPVVAGVSGATAINTSIAAKVQAYIDAFKAQLSQGGGAGPCTLDGQFATGTNSKTVLSLGLTVAEYLGGASSETLVGCLNYGVADGAPIALQDLFTTSAAGAGALSTQSRVQLKTLLGPSADVNWMNTGTAAVMTNFATSWVFLQTGLQITFPQLQVASAAEGTPRIVIAWSALKSVLKSNGPAAPYAG
jgi:hypothetical protein